VKYTNRIQHASECIIKIQEYKTEATNTPTTTGKEMNKTKTKETKEGKRKEKGKGREKRQWQQERKGKERRKGIN